MNVTNFSTKQATHFGTAPLRNMNILDDLIEKTKSRAKHLPGIVGFSGPSGFGKSTAASFAASSHQAYYVEIRSTWTKKAFLNSLLLSIGLTPAKIVNEMMDQVSEELANSQCPIILDEFDNAIDRGLIEIVRDLYEQSKCPIIIIGEERLPLKLKKFERFHGRVMAWAQALPADLSDAHSLRQHYVKDIHFEDDLLEHLVGLANGSVRRIVTNLDLIAQFARGENLKSIDLQGWGGRELHTGTPPKVRGTF